MSGDGGQDQPGPRRQRRRSATDTRPSENAPPKARSEPSARTSKPIRARRPRESGGLRDLAGAGPSYLGVVKAMRGRDVNRPTPDDLAQAERDVMIVRRNWKPTSEQGTQG